MTRETAAARKAMPLEGTRVLVADDSAANRRFVAWCLERAGAKVEVVEDGRALLAALTVPSGGGAALIEPAPVEIVLTDVEMPVVDGLTATRLLRRLGCTLPIVALTARSEPGDVDECLAAGCNAFSSKPIEAEALLSLVTGLLSRDGGESDSPASNLTVPPAASLGSPSVPANRAASPAANAASAEDPEVSSSRDDGPSAAAGADVLVSELADDPDMAELIHAFVGGLPGTVEGIEAALSSGRMEELARLAHQLKGAGGSYGYPSLTDAARALEADARAGAAVEAVAAGVACLAELCRAAVRGAESPALTDISDPPDAHRAEGLEVRRESA